MTMLPERVAERLQALTCRERAVAWLQIDSALNLVAAGGCLDHYGLAGLKPAAPILPQAFFLEGLLPLVEETCALPSMEFANGHAADLHLHRDADALWVILLDVSAERAAAQRVQQKAYDMTLAEEREALLIARLKRFFAPSIAEMIVSSGNERILESHRRDIAVVFCDLRGFTAFAESAEPEEVMELLHEYHGAVVPLIQSFEGTLDRFVGDGLIVYFNDPLPCPNSAERAVRLAVCMRDAVTALAQTWRRRGYHVGVGIGVAQGFATLGQIGVEGRFDYSAIGTVINTAARLCEVAKDGQILVTSRIAAAVADAADMVEIGQLTFKGLSRPLDVANIAALKVA